MTPGEQRRRRNIEQEVIGAATTAEPAGDWPRRWHADTELQTLLDQVYERSLDPISAAQLMAERVLGAPPD